MRQSLNFKISALALLASLILAPATPARADDLENAFRHPPAAAQPWVFWYWMQGAVSREGITADLAAMKQAGIGGAYLMPINGPANPPLFTPSVKQLTPEWWAMVKFAASEADRLGLKLGMNVCDGFATAGGPWITPELSMQKVVWSETIIEGGQKFAGVLPQPPTKENYYRDIAVLAFPTAGQESRESRVESPEPENRPLNPQLAVRSTSSRLALDSRLSTLDLSNLPRITTSLPGVDAQFLADGDGKKQLRSDGPCWIQYEYPAPFTLRSLVIRQWDHNYGGVYHASRLKLEASDDGINFRPITRLEPPRHGWQDWDADCTFAIAPVTAKFFRVIHDPAGAEAGSEDLDGAKWKPRLVLRGLELSSVARIPGYEGKSGAVWRKSSPATIEQLPADACVPANKIIDLTASLGADGRLDWTAPQVERSSQEPRAQSPEPEDRTLNAQQSPAGRWTILRIGHTSTGHRNETAGGGTGLECDKFNPAAVRAQFDGWFGEAVRQLGPELAGRALKIFHVDSWETGSQNWSPVFRAEFQRRRGYDPVPFLPTFAGVPIGSAAESEKFLADVRQTVSDLTTDNFFGTLATLAHAQGCQFSAESTAPTMMGDGMRHFGAVDLPTGEFWLRSPTHDKPNDIHDAVSGAHIYGKNIVQAEAFTELRLQWDEHPAMLKALADHEFALGINRFVFHVFAHNPWPDRKPGMTLNGVGLYFQRDQTWWRDAGAWVDYIARCSALLQAGRPVADVAYFTGEDLPSRAILPERRSAPLPTGYAADSINADALLRLATVKDGRLVLPGGASYAALVVGEGTLSRSLATKVRELKQGGLAVTGTGAELADALARNHAAPDLLTSAVDIEWTHRSTPDAEIYFLSNQQAAPRSVEISLRATGRSPELWYPLTGEVSVLPLGGPASPRAANVDTGRANVTVPLDPHGSVFIVLRTARAESKLERIQTSASPENQPFNSQPSTLNSQLSVLQSLDAPWQVTFDPSLGGPREPVIFPALTDWTAHATPGIRYYSGPAIYMQTFQWTRRTGRVWLDLGQVNNLAHVTVNGVDCGVAWTPPYRVEVTSALRAGANTIELRVTNTWSNRLLGDRVAPPASGPITWTNAPAREKAQLLPSGLLGPVHLIKEE